MKNMCKKINRETLRSGNKTHFNAFTLLNFGRVSSEKNKLRCVLSI